MTYRLLKELLNQFTEQQLDNHVLVEVGDNFYSVVSAEAASGEGDYLYKNEVFFTIDSDPLGEKTED